MDTEKLPVSSYSITPRQVAWLAMLGCLKLDELDDCTAKLMGLDPVDSNDSNQRCFIANNIQGFSFSNIVLSYYADDIDYPVEGFPINADTKYQILQYDDGKIILRCSGKIFGDQTIKLRNSCGEHAVKVGLPLTVLYGDNNDKTYSFNYVVDREKLKFTDEGKICFTESSYEKSIIDECVGEKVLSNEQDSSILETYKKDNSSIVKDTLDAWWSDSNSSTTTANNNTIVKDISNLSTAMDHESEFINTIFLRRLNIINSRLDTIERHLDTLEIKSDVNDNRLTVLEDALEDSTIKSDEVENVSNDTESTSETDTVIGW